MNKEEILQIVNEIFIDVLDNPSIVINLNTTADDVEDWDSLNHIQLVVAIEKRFNVRFKSSEIRNWENVNEMIESILAK
jgi:acyl carrier protein